MSMSFWSLSVRYVTGSVLTLPPPDELLFVLVSAALPSTGFFFLSFLTAEKYTQSTCRSVSLDLIDKLYAEVECPMLKYNIIVHEDESCNLFFKYVKMWKNELNYLDQTEIAKF